MSEKKSYTSDNLLQALENYCNRFFCQWRKGAVIFDAVTLKPDYSKTLCNPLYITKIKINSWDSIYFTDEILTSMS